MDFINHVVIGDNTPFTLNHWNGSVERDGHPVAKARGRMSHGGVTPWDSSSDALVHAQRLQPERQPGEDIFVMSHRALGEHDGEPTRYTYFIAIARCDAFTEE